MNESWCSLMNESWCSLRFKFLALPMKLQSNLIWICESNVLLQREYHCRPGPGKRAWYFSSTLLRGTAPSSFVAHQVDRGERSVLPRTDRAAHCNRSGPQLAVRSVAVLQVCAVFVVSAAARASVPASPRLLPANNSVVRCAGSTLHNIPV
jgi:hypothetical protein